MAIGTNNYCKGRLHEKGYSVGLHREGNNTLGWDVTDEPVGKHHSSLLILYYS